MGEREPTIDRARETSSCEPASRGGHRKFTVKTRQQSGGQILVSKFLFTRFTNSIIFLDFQRDLCVAGPLLGP